MALNSLDKQVKGATNEHLRKIYNTNAHNPTPKRRGLVKKHNCLNSEAKSEACLTIDHLSSRPSTRRNDNATPKEPLPHRSYSTAPFYKHEKMFKLKQKRRPSAITTRSTSNTLAEGQTNVLLHLDLPKDNPELSELVAPSNSKRSQTAKEESHSPDDQNKSTVGSAEDHEYLLFLLRITEDIISNEFYSNGDIRKIFKSHVELNKDRLNMRKMHLHIANLCKELNIDCKEYQAPEDVDHPDLLNKFQNSPNGHNYILSSEAFKNCEDCSVIRTSSLYKMQSVVEDFNVLGDNLATSLMDNMGDVTPASTSLLKLLETLSLGRVTERTEPVASTSTINSSSFNMSNSLENEVNNNGADQEQGPTDFDAFVKELNATETQAVQQKDENVVSLDNTPDEAVVDSLNQEVQEELPKNCNAVERTNETLTPIGGSKTDVDYSEKDVTPSYSTSDFEKCSTTNSTVTTARKAESAEEVTKDFAVHSELKVEKPSEMSPLEITASSKIPILIKEPDKLHPAQWDQVNCKFTSTAYSKSLMDLTVSPKQHPNSKLTHSVPTSARNNTCISKLHQNLVLPVGPKSDDSESILRSEESLKQYKSTKSNIQQQLVSSPRTSSFASIDPLVENEEMPCKIAAEVQIANSQTKCLKIILQDAIKDEDYVMIKGPVYVYKPLLNSEPKLVVFAENSEHSRRNSMESHKTFTVDDTKTNLDQGLQNHTSLHSLEADASMEHILELTRTAYSQFMDMKLLNSDYDLTPEKDNTDNKYHHLLVDATSSISGVNIPESLLLSDEYLVQNDRFTATSDKRIGESREEVAIENIIDDLGFRRFQPKICENAYVLQRKLTTSASMPRLKGNSNELLRGRAENTRSKSVVKKCSSDLIHFDLSSQDSSLRSEGEALHGIDPN